MPLYALPMQGVVSQTTPPLPTVPAGLKGKTLPSAQNLDAPKTLPIPPVESATAIPAEEKNSLIIEAADSLGFESPGVTDVASAVGNVHLRYNGYKITCDRASFDRTNRVATLEGHATIDTGRQILFYDYLRLNLRTNNFFGRQGRTVAPPDTISTTLLQPLRLSASTLERNGRITVAEEGFLTTCDFDLPHYKIGFRKATVLQNDRIAMRDVKIYFGDRVVFKLRYLSVPIREQVSKYAYLPLVGRTNEEGYFIKNAIGYSFGNAFPGYFRLDQMEKKGTGIGFDQAYAFGKNVAGALFLYTLNDRSRDVRNLSGRLQHQQRIGTVLAAINSDFQSNSYNSISSQSKTANTTVNLTRQWVFGTSGINFNIQNSDYGLSQSKNFAYTVTQDARWGNFQSGGGDLSLRFNSTRNVSISKILTGGLESGRQDQNGDITANLRAGRFDVRINANKNIQAQAIGQAQSGFYGGTQRLPEFLLSLNQAKQWRFLQPLQSSFGLGFARYLESPNSTTNDRLLFTMDANPKTYDLNRSKYLTLNLTGGFRQSIYNYGKKTIYAPRTNTTDALTVMQSGETMQYILSGGAILTQKISSISNVSFNYRYLRPYGGLPLNFTLDQQGAYNNANLNLQIEGKRIRVSAFTGYDFLRATDKQYANYPRNPWQNLSLQLYLRPVDPLEARFTFSYDINTHRLIDTTNQVRVRFPWGFALDTGLRYDPRTHKFPQIIETLETPLIKGFRVGATSRYNGITKKFEYKNYALTRSYHDYEVSVRFVDQPYGFRTERGFNVAIRLKAFPDYSPAPTGQYGTAFDTGLGSSF